MKIKFMVLASLCVFFSISCAVASEIDDLFNGAAEAYDKAWEVRNRYEQLWMRYGGANNCGTDDRQWGVKECWQRAKSRAYSEVGDGQVETKASERYCKKIAKAYRAKKFKLGNEERDKIVLDACFPVTKMRWDTSQSEISKILIHYSDE